MKLLNVDSLSVSYSHIPTVKDISFSVRSGEIVGLVGESGCGKSTLLRTLMMLMEENCQIDKGAVFFEETDLTKLSEKELRLLRGKDIVMIFQNAALSSNPLHKIGHQFYETITSHSGKISKKECYAKAEDILKKLKFKEPKRILNSYPFELSGGMNQRVALALAILMNPKLILADEPTGNLDSASSKEILQILKSMHEQGKTVILITHDNGIAAQARRVVRIMDGKIESDFINKNYGKEEYIKNQLDA